MQFIQNNSRLIFRLFAALCVLLIFTPSFISERGDIENSANSNSQEIPVADGMGGGVLLEKIIAKYEKNIENSNLGDPSLRFAARSLLFDNHIIQSGENISGLAIRYGLHQSTLISVNNITNTRLLQIGRVLRIPNQDGIFHNVRSGETLETIAQRYNADPEAIRIANELFSDNVRAGTDLFIPGARLDWGRIQEINGDLFIWPVNGRITSHFGYRRDPFNPSRRQFHNGIDIRGNVGTPVRAAMAGRVSRVGYDPVFGNFVIINHHSGYRTLYGHLNVIRTRPGAYVGQGERIGDVGNTGLSTGPHLHFTVFRNGVPINPRPLMR